MTNVLGMQGEWRRNGVALVSKSDAAHSEPNDSFLGVSVGLGGGPLWVEQGLASRAAPRRCLVLAQSLTTRVKKEDGRQPRCDRVGQLLNVVRHKVPQGGQTCQILEGEGDQTRKQ